MTPPSEAEIDRRISAARARRIAAEEAIRGVDPDSLPVICPEMARVRPGRY